MDSDRLDVEEHASAAHWQIDPHDVAVVQETFPLLHSRSDEVAAYFYATLFTIAPNLQPMFRTELVAQGDKLMAMLAVAVHGLSNVETIARAMRDLGDRHVGYGVEERHYTIVREALLRMVCHFITGKSAAEVERAWGAGYDLLAGLMLEGAANRTEDVP